MDQVEEQPEAKPEPVPEVADLAAYDAETVRLLNEKALELSRIKAEWDDYHAQASAAKKQFELIQGEIRALIRERQEQRGKPVQPDLFSGVKLGTPIEGMRPDAEVWRNYPITAERWGRWGLTEKDVEKLNAGDSKSHGVHPILTIGDLNRFITPDPSNPAYARSLTDIKGFGPAAYERWQTAETQFWSWWNSGGEREFTLEMGVAIRTEPPAEAEEF